MHCYRKLSHGQCPLMPRRSGLDITWIRYELFHHLDLPPRFPRLSNQICTSSLSDFISLLIPRLPLPLQLLSPHDLSGEMTLIFQVLRLLSSFMAHPSINPEDQKIFNRGLYITEYSLLIILDQDSDEDYAPLKRNSHIYGSTRLAAYLYLYMVLREIPTTTMINYTLAKRLKGILERKYTNLLMVWREDLHLLL